ncbi:DUF4142 domain-containing protein [Dyadobacter sp. CY261]|uniref:DUF4142 domain-containing protein n=1 Tax=Dyadobacter sp. CY261 TaxID=2907203 RepID=UPI001F26A19C|nr:DUF4142 domain-containing protein [Dyadobacter sp. CY261]MCF0069321.1 DUF4142 domain-containing protein [Dyadobacter sp. CY261]
MSLSSLSCSLKESPVTPEIDKRFINSASDLNLFCITASQTALTAATSTRVRQYAQEVIANGETTNRELISLAWQKGIQLKDLSETNTQKIDSLQTKSIKDFDYTFMDMAVDAHYQLVALYETEIQSGNDLTVRNWAKGKLSAVREDLEKAQLAKEAM